MRLQHHQRRTTAKVWGTFAGETGSCVTNTVHGYETTELLIYPLGSVATLRMPNWKRPKIWSRGNLHKIVPNNINRESWVKIPEVWISKITKHSSNTAVRQQTTVTVKFHPVAAEHNSLLVTCTQLKSSPAKEYQYAAKMSIHIWRDIVIYNNNTFIPIWCNIHMDMI